MQQHAAASGMQSARDRQRPGCFQLDAPIGLDQPHAVVSTGVDRPPAACAARGLGHPDRSTRIDRACPDADFIAGIDPPGNIHAGSAEIAPTLDQCVQMRSVPGGGQRLTQQTVHCRLRRGGDRKRTHIQHSALANDKSMRVGEKHPTTDLFAHVAVERAVDERPRIPHQVDNAVGTLRQTQIDRIARAHLESAERIEINFPPRASRADINDVVFHAINPRTQVPGTAS